MINNMGKTKDNSAFSTSDEKIDKFLREAVEKKTKEINLQSSFESKNGHISSSNDLPSEDNLDPNYYIKKANASVLLDTLAPEIRKNEEKKREHKDKLIKYVSIFLGAQFLIIFILILIVIISIVVFHAINKDLSQDTVRMLFAFFWNLYYISNC